MVRKTYKTGNCIVISLPREALKYLGIKEGAAVSVELDRQRRQIVMTPIDVPMAVAGVDEEFAHKVKNSSNNTGLLLKHWQSNEF